MANEIISKWFQIKVIIYYFVRHLTHSRSSHFTLCCGGFYLLHPIQSLLVVLIAFQSLFLLLSPFHPRPPALLIRCNYASLDCLSHSAFSCPRINYIHQFTHFLDVLGLPSGSSHLSSISRCCSHLKLSFLHPSYHSHLFSPSTRGSVYLRHSSSSPVYTSETDSRSCVSCSLSGRIHSQKSLSSSSLFII